MTLKQSDLCFLAVPSNVSAIFHPQRLHSALCSAAQPKDGPGREPLVSKTSASGSGSPVGALAGLRLVLRTGSGNDYQDF